MGGDTSKGVKTKDSRDNRMSREFLYYAYQEAFTKPSERITIGRLLLWNGNGASNRRRRHHLRTTLRPREALLLSEG